LRSSRDSGWFTGRIFMQKNISEAGLNERQIKAVMYVKEKGKISNKEYQGIYGVKERLASIELTDLVNKGVFVKLGTTGRGTFYAVPKTQKAQ
jgi:ATP-dependent DNA helicase RecG